MLDTHEVTGSSPVSPISHIDPDYSGFEITKGGCLGYTPRQLEE